MVDLNKVFAEYIAGNIENPIDRIINRNLAEENRKLKLDIVIEIDRMLNKKINELRKDLINSGVYVANKSDKPVDYLDRNQTLRFLNISNATLTKHVNSKKLVPYTKGKKHYFKKTELEKFLKRQEDEHMELIYAL